MDEEIERLVVSVRADTQGFARDVAEMRASIDGPLQAGADRASDRRGKPVCLHRHLVAERETHVAGDRKRIAFLAGRVYQQAKHEVGELVARRALHRPVLA